MRPTFTRVLYYRVRFACVTPLRSGDLDQDEKDLLRRRDGTVFLPAGAITGALRNWKDNPVLFGTTGKASSLIISDALITNSRIIFRHRINLREKIQQRYLDTGSGINRTNREIAVLPRGTSGEFTIVWRGTDPFEEIEPVIEEYLAAMDSGQIQLGAERSNDFGRVKLSVFRGCFDMMKETQREAWLSGQWEGSPITLPQIPQQETVLDVSAKMPSIFIGSTFGNLHYAEDGRLVVPSSSIKGVLRRWCGQLCPVFGKPELEDILFGSTTSAGILVVSDGFYSEPHRLAAPRRILIDRVSGSLVRPPYAAHEPVSGELHLQLRIGSSYKQAIGLLLYVLRDFGLGMFELGSSSAVGWGYAESVTVQLSAPKGTGVLSVADGAVTIDDPNGIIHQCTKKIGGRRT